MLVAVVVILGLALRRNWNRQAWLVLLPPLAVTALLSLLDRLASGAFYYFVQEVDALIIREALVLAILLLLADRLPARPRILSVLAALGILWGTGLIMTIAATLGDVRMVWQTIVLGLMNLALVLALVIAGLACRRTFSVVKFGLWMLGGCVVLCILPVLTVGGLGAIVMTIHSGGGLMGALSYLLYIGAYGVGFGLLLFILWLPYMALLLRVPFFRARFDRVMRPAPLPPPPAP